MPSDHEPSGGPVPVVVAIDDAGSAGDAVDWATAEAAARGCPLAIVHAFRPPVPVDPYGVTLPLDSLFTARTAGRVVLRAAVSRARAVASDVEESTLLRLDMPVRALLDAAAGGAMLVVGHRNLHGLRGLLAGSVSVQTAAHAACPVVVVRPGREGGDPARSRARVVVGVDGTPACAPAVGFAFRAARQRGLPVEALHAWIPDPPAGPAALGAVPVLAELLARRALGRSLDRWRREFPDVPVVTSLVRDDAARVLVAASRGAALTVVGSRGRGHLLGTAPRR